MDKVRRATVVLAALWVAVLVSPFRLVPDHLSAADQAMEDALLQQVRAATKPVASEDMVVLLRAGKHVFYEPSIVTELAAVGRWDERPLVDMVSSGGFAFMLSEDNQPGPTTRRSLAVDEAMRQAYPVVELARPGLWMHRPR